MQNKLIAKVKVNCNTCGCQTNRRKTIKVNAMNMEAAKKEATEKIIAWKKTLIGKNCQGCQRIIDAD